MRCPSCGHQNRTGASFCDDCGSALASSCPSCGTELRPTAKFCDSCGQTVSDPGELARSPTPQPVPALPATFAAGRYKVERLLGEGGKKRVYLARDTKLETDVAVAFIKTDGLDADGLVRIRREAQAMGRLRDHPHIVTVLDIGDEAGQPYMIQEVLRGGSLDDLLQKEQEHRLPAAQTLRIGDEICQALQYAHRQGIIHRDLKPGNIWLTQDGTAKLGDFGLAVAVDQSRLTQSGMMVGTSHYMPPEQALGGDVTPASDLYSLGCVLYEMAAGRPPFLGDDSLAIISQHVNTQPVAPIFINPEMPQALDALIRRLLAKAPGERPENAAAVIEELRRIHDSATPQAAAVATEVPSTGLQGIDWGRFVGRREELDQLKGALENTLSGQGALVMLVGEPGIGKTRLAEEFGVYASLRGAQVLTGRCYEGEVALPYRPFIDMFRQYVRERPDQELHHQLGEGAPEVAKLVSEVRQRFPDIPESPPLDPEAERMRLFESISAFVRNAAAANPLVLFLDDIHWADKPSLLLMRYLARSVASERVLILAAYRDVELDRTHPLSEVVATLRREQPYERVLLRGLPEEDVLAFLTASESSEAVGEGRNDLALALYRETEGNPFFIRSVLSHLYEEGQLYREGGVWIARTNISELGIPEGVREVVGKRLSRLSESCNRMLTLASTMTTGFSWEALKAISDESEAALLDLLDEALAAQLVSERRGSGAGSYDFTHALIRQTPYGELSTPRRVLLHRQIGEALEQLYGDSQERHLAELAHHFFQAAPGGDVDKALDYATRAGDRAVELFAHEEAVGHYRVALQALDLKGTSENQRRSTLLLALGEAELRSEMPEESFATLQQAAALADGLGDNGLQTKAALIASLAVNRGPLWGTGAAGPLLRQALASLSETDSAERAKLLAELSLALDSQSSREERTDLAKGATEMAGRVKDLHAQARSLGALRSTLIGPKFTEERLTIGAEWVRTAEEIGEAPEILSARQARILDLSELGDMEQVRSELPVMWELADRMREPAYGGWRPIGTCMLAALSGHYDQAEQLVLEYAPIAQRMQQPQFLQSVGAQLYEIRWGQGRLEELEQPVSQSLQGGSNVDAWRAALAVIYLDTGRPEQARQCFDRLAEDGFDNIPHNSYWIVTLVLCAYAAHRLQDPLRAELLYDVLRPFAARQGIVHMALCIGSVSYSLGQLAATLERWDDARRHFEEAITFNERVGANAWLGRARYEYAAMLHGSALMPHRGSAADLVNLALATFEELGMKREVERALGLKMALQGVIDVDAKTSIDVVASAVQAERPDLTPHSAPDGTITLFFTDIEGSTPLNSRLGDQRWMALLRRHNAIIREQLRVYEGYEVKTEGDGFMVAFGDATRAVLCAVAIQCLISTQDWHEMASLDLEEAQQLRVSIGLHTGEAIREAGDFYGNDVNLAARIANEAKGGEILVSGRLRELIESPGDVAFDDGRDVVLKGLPDSQRVFSVAWE